jgi:putative tryptophan/tyrosine transport system substrate-binding protein
MTAASIRWFLGLLLAIAAIAGAAAEPRVLIVREDSAVSRQAMELLSKDLIGMGWSVGDVSVSGDRPFGGPAQGEQALVALGSRAFMAALRHSGGKPVIAALITQASIDEMPPAAGDRWTAILLDQPLDRWISLLQQAFPGIQQVGMLAGPGSQRAIHNIERRMGERRLALVSEQISSSEEVVPAIERLVPRMGVLLALPDPVAHNRNTVQPLLLTTYRSGIPVVAYSESYQQAGAVVALYSTVPQVVAQVIDSLQQVRDGKALPNIQAPRYFTVGVNATVARSLGLSLPSASDLAGRLRSQGQ